MKLRFGIVGCGHIGRRHASLATRFGELVALCDIRKDKALSLSMDYPAKLFDSIHTEVEGMVKPELFPSGEANNYGFYEGSMNNHQQVYQLMIDCITNSKPAFVDPAEAAKTVDIISSIYEVMQNRKISES